MLHYMIIFYFHLHYLHVSDDALFFTWYSGTLLIHKCSHDTFYGTKLWNSLHDLACSDCVIRTF